MISTINANIIRHINNTLQPKVEPKVETKVETKVEPMIAEIADEIADEITNENDDASDDESIEKYKPKKISFLTLSDDDEKYTPKKPKQVKPNSSGKYLCDCGVYYTPSNKARHEQSFRHKCYIANQSSNE